MLFDLLKRNRCLEVVHPGKFAIDTEHDGLEKVFAFKQASYLVYLCCISGGVLYAHVYYYAPTKPSGYLLSISTISTYTYKYIYI